MNSLLSAIKAFVLKSRPAYKDYLGDGKYDVKKLPEECVPDSVNNKIGRAQRKADSAYNEARRAMTNADDAWNIANEAWSTANTAKSTADAAKSTADAAKSTADAAQSTANAAQSAANIAQTTANNALPKSGGTMTGSLILKSDPTADKEAATKKYVDDKTGVLLPTVSSSDNGKFLRVVDGTWSASSISNAEEASF